MVWRPSTRVPGCVPEPGGERSHWPAPTGRPRRCCARVCGTTHDHGEARSAPGTMRTPRIRRHRPAGHRHPAAHTERGPGSACSTAPRIPRTGRFARPPRNWPGSQPPRVGREDVEVGRSSPPCVISPRLEQRANTRRFARRPRSAGTPSAARRKVYMRVPPRPGVAGEALSRLLLGLLERGVACMVSLTTAEAGVQGSRDDRRCHSA